MVNPRNLYSQSHATVYLGEHDQHKGNHVYQSNHTRYKNSRSNSENLGSQSSTCRQPFLQSCYCVRLLWCQDSNLVPDSQSVAC